MHTVFLLCLGKIELTNLFSIFLSLQFPVTLFSHFHVFLFARRSFSNVAVRSMFIFPFPRNYIFLFPNCAYDHFPVFHTIIPMFSNSPVFHSAIFVFPSFHLSFPYFSVPEDQAQRTRNTPLESIRTSIQRRTGSARFILDKIQSRERLARNSNSIFIGDWPIGTRVESACSRREPEESSRPGDSVMNIYAAQTAGVAQLWVISRFLCERDRGRVSTTRSIFLATGFAAGIRLRMSFTSRGNRISVVLSETRPRILVTPGRCCASTCREQSLLIH